MSSTHDNNSSEQEDGSLLRECNAGKEERVVGMRTYLVSKTSQALLSPRLCLVLQLAGASGRSGLLVTLRAASKGGGRGGEEAAHSRRVAMRRMDVVSRRVVRKWAAWKKRRTWPRNASRKTQVGRDVPKRPSNTAATRTA